MSAAPGLPAWTTVVAPHPEILAARGGPDAFAADLAQVAAGSAPPEQGDSREFFARTFPTAGLRRLLSAAAGRAAGGDGAPVAVLRTGFGGGKTHALLAVYHLLSGDGAGGIPAAPTARRAVLSGTEFSPARPWSCRALGGRPVRTLWGEMAAQLGGAEGYALVAAEDAAGIPPGAAALAELLRRQGPCAILLDEPLAYLRALHGRRATAAGSFDGNLTFLQSLSEAVRRVPAALLVAALPASEAEAGGEGGRAAAAALAAIFTRVEAVWGPAGAEEVAAVARHRLFGPAAPGAEATCRAYAALYSAAGAPFPAECARPEYAQRLAAAYPLHPELLERLGAGFAPQPAFQGARGMLRLLAAAVRARWPEGAGPLLQPGDLPLEDPGVREPLLACLGPGWQAVLEADAAGPASAAAALERADPRLGAAGLARRVAAAVLLATPEGGVERSRLHLGVLRPGEGPAALGDALQALLRRLGHLHGDRERAWFSPQANLNRRAADRAAALEPAAVHAELDRQLAALARGGGAAAAAFAAVQALAPGQALTDRPAAVLHLLPVAAPHAPGGGQAAELAGRLLAGCPRHPHMPVFLAADERHAPALLTAARDLLAWTALRSEPGAAEGLLMAERVLRLRLAEAYRWLLFPAREGTGLEAVEVPGSGEPLGRAAAAAVRDEIVLPDWSPAGLRLELDRWLWPGADHVPLARVWECLTRYAYLPRLRDWGVLARVVAAGVAEGVHFAHAEGREANGAYRGLRRGVAGLRLRPGDAGLLVRPEAVATAGTPDPPPQRATGFRGQVRLRPERLEADAARVAAEVVRPLAAVPGVRVHVRLEIEAEAPAGLPPATERVLRENAATLGFSLPAGGDGRPA